jgi:PKD repeat protein
MTNMKKQMKLLGAAVLGLTLLGIAAPTAHTATTATLTAMVTDQVCQGGDNVNVTLTATLSPPKTGVTYTWDFNNDGIFDTAPSTDPTVTHLYPDEANVTATVKVTKGRRSATDSVTFATIRCGG